MTQSITHLQCYGQQQWVIVRHNENKPDEYHVGFGQFSNDRDKAIRYTTSQPLLAKRLRAVTSVIPR